MTRARRPDIAVTLAFLAAAAGARAQDAAPAAEPPAATTQDRGEGSGPPLAFAWPVPSRVKVTETQVKDERTIVSRYVVELERAPEGDGVAMRCSGFELVSVDGLDLSDPKAQKAAASVAAMSEAVPTLLVDADGRARGVLANDDAVERVLAHLKESGTDDETIASLGRMLRAPPVVATMRQKAFDNWMLWVGAWVGLRLQPGETLHTELEVPMPDGALASAPTVVRHLGLESAASAGATAPQLAHLNADSVLEGEAVRLALGRVVGELLAQSPPAPGQPLDADMIETFRRTSRLSVLTDPATLRPQEASLEITQVLALKGLGSRTKLERHEYVFDWSADPEAPSAPAEGAAPPPR